MTGGPLTANLEALARAGLTDLVAGLEAVGDAEVDQDGDDLSDVFLAVDGRRVRLHSRRDPVGEAARLLSDETTTAPVVVLIGAGAGFGVDALEQRGFTGRILILEPVAAHAAAMLRRRSLVSLIDSGRLRLLCGPGYVGWLGLSAWMPTRAVPVAVVVQPVLAREIPADVKHAADVLRRLLFNAQANEGARRTFAGPYLRNTLAHLPELVQSRDVRALFGHFAGTAACVLAAGPSLNRNLEALRADQDRFVVLAVDTALRTCLDAGIAPDFVVAVDPAESNRRHLAVTQVPARTSLVAEPSVARGSFDAFSGRVYTFRVDEHHPWPWLRRHGVDRGVLAAWGSVLTTTLDLAVRLGCSPIHLLGADFAYTGGQPYCRGTVYEEDWTRNVADGARLEDVWRQMMRQPTLTERGVDGHDAETSAPLQAFRDWVEDFCARRSGVTFVNATGAGLLKKVPSGALQPTGNVAPLRASLERDDRASDGTSDLLDTAVESLRRGDQEPWVTWAREANTLPKDAVAAMLAAAPERREAAQEAYLSWRSHPWSAEPRPAGAPTTAAPRLWYPRHEPVVPAPFADFRSDRWQRMNRRRLEHLATLPLGIGGARVLELGAGIGDHTDFFLDRGCQVTAVEGRDALAAVVRDRFRDHPALEVVTMDLDPPARWLGEFDVVVCYGLLYLMSDPLPLLDWAAASADRLLIVETLVLDADEDAPRPIPVHPQATITPLGGRGNLPPRAWVWSRLAARFPHVYLPRTQPSHPEFPLTWGRGATGATRSVFVGARHPLDEDAFVSELALTQVNEA
jgi:SAM-dependent methyltransferase